MAEKLQKPPYDLHERTFLFAVRVIKWSRTLPKDIGSQVALKQMLESATSVGANIEEADGADTPKDRVYKWTLSRKEARETHYWLRVILTANDLESEEGSSLVQETAELVKILSALIRKGKDSLG